MRYSMARGAFHDRNTASIDARSCAQGSSGTGATRTAAIDVTSRSLQAAAIRGPSPTAVDAFSPTFRIVSIIPGIDTGAPDRTLTSNGLPGLPKLRPANPSSRDTWTRSSSSSPAGQPLARYSRQTSVVSVNAGGTGRSRSSAITVRLAALPPTSRGSSSRDSPSGGRSKSTIRVKPLPCGHASAAPARRAPATAAGRGWRRP